MKCEICQDETDDLLDGKCQNCYDLDREIHEDRQDKEKRIKVRR